jgi:hypothetical protein
MAEIRPNWFRYLLSLAQELESQSTRVRDLIGGSHWLSDGHHKEYLLLGLLQRHLPLGMIAARGFVVSPTDPEKRSKEQDILIVDALQEAPVFHDGGLVISFPRQVRAAISVKSTMSSASIDDSVTGLNTVKSLARSTEDYDNIWCGAYFFAESESINLNPKLAIDNLASSLANARQTLSPTLSETWRPCGLNLFATSARIAIQIRHRAPSAEGCPGKDVLSGFNAAGLSTSIFLADLLEHLATTRGSYENDFSLMATQAFVSLIDNPTVVE